MIITAIIFCTEILLAKKTCEYTRVYKYSCINTNGLESKPELEEISYYDSNGSCIYIVFYKNQKIDFLKVYTLDSLNNNISYTLFNERGEKTSEYISFEDSSTNKIIPFVELSIVIRCGGEVKCKKNTCDQITEQIIYSVSEPKFIISKYKYEYR